MKIYFQVLPLLLATLALSNAGVLEKQSSVSVKHVGKDFSYSIEETHKIGLGSPAEFRQQKPTESIVPSTNIEVMKTEVDSSPNVLQEKGFVDEQALADQTVQIIPESVLAEITSNVEGQTKNVEVKEENDPTPDSKSESAESISKDDTPVANEHHGKRFILFEPHSKGMIEKSDIEQIYKETYQPVKVVYSNYRMMHNGFRPYQPFGYYYPFGLVRLV